MNRLRSPNKCTTKLIGKVFKKKKKEAGRDAEGQKQGNKKQIKQDDGETGQSGDKQQ